jgi:hypothetical protein
MGTIGVHPRASGVAPPYLARMTKPLQFPDPAEVTDRHPAVLRSNDDMISIYNAEHGSTANNLSKKVRIWIMDEAKRRGWGRVVFPLTYPSKTLIAGCVFEKL